MGRSVSARPPADEKREESRGDEKPQDEKREQPSFRPSKQDPFYLGLRLDVRKARRNARKTSEKASHRRRWAADSDFRDRKRAGRYGLSLQDYREAARRDDGNQRSAPGKGSIRFHDLVFSTRRCRTRTEAWKLHIRRLFSRILCS